MKHLTKVVLLMFEDYAMEPHEFDVPKNFDNVEVGGTIDWDRVEKFLATLTEEDLETFAIGDQDDIMRIAIAYDGKEGEYAHWALDTLFEAIGC